ncbi:SusC/RagA family TonB-linked outer membrane protein [Parapedobacter sp. 2B3]|uniref:SusC/RagA family TonB-linked outer membrane protein n=1 Tax=Parapedobacter sp. 2B3 TaxID=3342381 RepID=UPI0035B5AA13
MKRFSRFGESYAFFRYKLKQSNIQYISLLAVTIMCLQARAQQRESFAVTGKVISAASGVAIEGATITNKRSRIHAVTDRLGEYRIPARPDDILLYSFVGYVTAEEDVNGRQQIIVALDSAENTLEEVEINMGYYTVRDRERTGSVARITAETIEKQVITNPLSAMQGRMAGVEITQNTGIAGGAFSVAIRGQSSMGSGNAPLYLIDGVPLIENRSAMLSSIIREGNLLDVLNPSDISNIEVLKDADATAIYGSRGANGVVLITTKKGTAGKTRFDVSARFGGAKVASFVDLLDAREYKLMRNEAFANDGVIPTESNAYDLLLWDDSRYTDWQKELIGGTASLTNLRGSVTGGQGNTNFILSGNYQREGNVFPGDGSYQKGSAHLNVNHKSVDGALSINAGVTYGIRYQNQPQIDLTSLAMTLPPNAPALYDKEGKLNWENWVNIEGNPLQYLGRIYGSHTATLNTHATVEYSILPGLNLTTRMGYSIVDLAERLLNPASSQNPNPASGATPESWAQYPSNTAKSWSLEPMIDYNYRWNDNALSTLIGITLQESTNSGQVIEGRSYIDELLMGNIASASRINGSTTSSQYKYAAMFLRLNYKHQNRYFINLTARRDGSSRFGPGRQWGNFGAVGVAWLFSEESIVKRVLPWLDLGKLRGSFGITGNDQIGDYGYLATYRPNSFYPYLINSLQPLRLANKDYGWETNRKLEAAIELGVFENKLTLESSWYRNRSGNQLIGLPLPATAGFPTVQANFPATVQNSGIEFTVHGSGIGRGWLNWTASLTFAKNIRNLVKFPTIETFSSYRGQYKVGEPMNISLKYRYLGIDPKTGSYVVEDLDDDKAYSLLNDGYWYRPKQPFTVGFDNQFQLGPIHFSFFIRWRSKESSNPLFIYGLPGRISNQPNAVMDRWQAPEQVAEIQRFSTGTANADFSRFRGSDGSMVNGSYVRLQNVSIAYQIPANISESLHVKAARLSIHGQNLLTWSRNYPWLDPELSGLVLPPLRSMVVGIQLTM